VAEPELTVSADPEPDVEVGVEVVGVEPAGAEVDEDPAPEVVVLVEAAFEPEEQAAAVRATAARTRPSIHRFEPGEPADRGAEALSRRLVEFRSLNISSPNRGPWQQALRA
jgi:hypothetical protein